MSDATLGDLLRYAQSSREQPSPLERIGRGMTDLYEPAASLYYGFTDPAKQTQYDAQRKDDVALYLRGLLGTSIPEQLRGAVPDIWRALGQSAPFFALGPMGGLSSFARKGVAGAAANTLGSAAIGQPAMYTPELWDYMTK